MNCFNLSKKSGSVGMANAVVITAMFLLAINPAVAQQAAVDQNNGVGQYNPLFSLSLPTDWTHHSVIFSPPDSTGDKERLTNEPRAWQQWLRHEGRGQGANPHSPGASSPDSRPSPGAT